MTLSDPFTGLAIPETIRVVLTHNTVPDLPDNF